MTEKVQKLVRPFRSVRSAFGRLWNFVRSRPKSSIAMGIVLVLLLLLVAQCTRPAEPQYLTQVVERRDLHQVVEAVGEVISERDLKLQFPMTGVVESVRVQEGDRVRAGQELARLRSSGLGADVASANAEVQAAQAELSKLQQGTRPEEIAVTEASVQSKRAALEAAREDLETAQRNLQLSQNRLEALRREAETALQGYVLTVQSDISRQLSAAESAVRVLEGLWIRYEVTDALTRHRPGQLELYRERTREVIDAVIAARSAVVFGDYRQAQTSLQQARDVIMRSAILLDDAYTLLATMEVTPSYSQTVQEEIKTSISTERANVQAALSAIDTSLRNIRDAAAAYDTRIVQEEANVAQSEGVKNQAQSTIQTTEATLRIEEAQLQLQRSGSRPADIASAQARLSQAYASLQRARERLRDTVIVAPIDGVVTMVALKEGELLSTAFASDAAITMLGDEPFRVEMFVAEIDVPRVRIGQSGSILLDAFSDRPFALVVSELDPTATEVDGVPKYRVKLDFIERQEELRIGMTGDAEIETNFRSNVLVVPGRAVIRNEEGREVLRVLQEDGTLQEQPVEAGLEGVGGNVEIISGIDEGDVVVELVRES